MRALIIGDSHATPEELQDCQALVSYAALVASSASVDEVILLGDLYHTHAIVHVEVMAFWSRALRKLASVTGKVKVVLGNHDMPGNEASASHALIAQEAIPGVEIISAPNLECGVAYIPYMPEAGGFVAAAQELGGNTLVCHQTFNGSMFENGFYAKDGIDSNLLTQELVISGHIHAPQSFGKVWYPGAPRWRTLSDANTERSIWVVEFGDEGSVIKRTPHSMLGVCREIRHMVDTEETPIDPNVISPGSDWRIDIKGSSAWCNERKAILQGPGRRIRTFPVTATAIVVKESEGIAQAFSKYIGSHESKRGTSAERLKQLASERIQWK